MYLILCFVYCFFAIVLGMYLGLELISVRRADRMARTILKAAARAQQSSPPVPLGESEDGGVPNYFATK